MMHKARAEFSIFLSAVLFILGSVLLLERTPPAYGQDRIPSSRRPSCGCYVCGKLLAADFPNKAPNCAGILAEDACPTALGGDLPEADRPAFCKKLRGSLSAADFRSQCPAYAKMCGEAAPDKKCEKPAPWFDNSSSPGSGCKDFQAPTVRVEDGTAYLQMCGSSVFAYKLPTADPRLVQTYKDQLLERTRSAFGKGVCCDKFREAIGPDSACDPRFDLDCDGILNPSDRTPDGMNPEITLGTIASGVPSGSIDPMPPWVEEKYSTFVPPVKLCDCKWELLRAKRTCSPDGTRSHVYQARWRCPSTGNERFTRVEAPAYESCGPVSKDLPSIFFPYLAMATAETSA